jgi:uncharacterized membrane protein
MEELVKHILENLNLGSKELAVVICSMLPIIELRGGIPIGILYFELKPITTYFLCVFGNIIPVIPLVIFFGKIEELLARNAYSNKVIQWYIAKVRHRTARIEKLEMWGLALFVAIPLPVTGAWTGSVAAFLMGIGWRKALVSISCGVLIAGIIVTALTLGGAKIYSFL